MPQELPLFRHHRERPYSGWARNGGVLTGPNSPSSVWSDRGSYRLPNTRLSLTVTKSINTAIIVVDLPRMKGVNLG